MQPRARLARDVTERFGNRRTAVEADIGNPFPECL
ncbi:MAG: hypothetical protein QOK29_495, partial [Rhodospirillaceae bacterium]|nr:hypothetical protein [Rhodospirillaceae bacterium]